MDGFKELDKTVQPFNDARHRQWKNEFGHTINNKPLPPLPKTSLPASAQVTQPGPERSAAVSQAQLHQSVQGELFVPLQPPKEVKGSAWEKQAQKFVERRKLGEKERHDEEVKSMRSRVAIAEDRQAKGCCCVM